MESNEQIELTQNRHRLIDKEQADNTGGCGQGVEGWNKTEKGLMDIDSSVMLLGVEWWWVVVEKGLRGINGNVFELFCFKIIQKLNY